MAYSNEYLTEEEIELLKQTEHDRIIRKSKEETICLKKICTVDREKRRWLLEYRYDGFTYDPSTKEKYFVVFWGKIHKDNMLEICLKDLGDETIKNRQDVEFIEYWAVKKIIISSELNITEELVVKELEEMMTAYAFSGRPEENKVKGKIKAIFKEYKEV